MKHFERTWHLKLDTQVILNIINKNKDKFFCPFSNVESYLNVYKNRECSVQFFNLQECDYSGSPVKAGHTYIKYLMSIERKLKNTDQYNFLKNNYDKFVIETNEENFCIPSEDPDIKKLLLQLKFDWSFGQRDPFGGNDNPQGNICRARILKLPAKGTMQYHRDETDSKNIRIMCPIVTHPDIKNAFKDKNGEKIYHFPASGHYYAFKEHTIEHAVFNDSDIDRYALIFSVINVDNLKEWDRKYYKNRVF